MTGEQNAYPRSCRRWNKRAALAMCITDNTSEDAQCDPDW